MSTVNCFSTAFLPPIDYFVCLLNSDKILIEQHENYIRQTYRNRCYIYGPNGIQLLSLPAIKTDGNNKQIRDIQIAYHTDWQSLHRKSIETAYNSSPFFIYYWDDLLPFFTDKYENLLEYNTKLLAKVLEQIGLKKEIKYTESYIKSEDLQTIQDYRYSITPKLVISNLSLIIDHPPYVQVFNSKYGFIPNLSIIDLIFNLGPDALDYLNSCKGSL